MKKRKWSHSRFECFEECLIKYKNTYIENFTVTGKPIELADKGSAFHSIAEYYTSDKTLEDLLNYAPKILEEYNVDEYKYPILKTIPRFYAWWNEYVKPLENKGYTLLKEHWMDFKFPNQNDEVCGAIDVLLYNQNEKKAFIFDYKTGKYSKISDGYSKQLQLYIYAIGLQLGLSLKETVSNIKAYLFFPLADIKDEELTDAQTCQTQMLKNVKEIICNEFELEKLILERKNIINRSNNFDWSLIKPTDGRMKFSCSWCPFAGLYKDKNYPEFIHCENSHLAGIYPLRSAKLTKKTN